jgi:hypothetical protein
MKTYLALVGYLALLPFTLTPQEACLQAPATVIERRESFTVFSVSLPSRLGRLTAKAVIPNANRPAGAFVFSLSALAGSEPAVLVQMMPVAIDLAKRGRPAIVLQRELTWPEVAESVGHSQADVLCAEQWLAAHAAVKADDWMFVGPEADRPTFEELHAVGDNTSMTFSWGFPLAGLGENKNTENVLRRGALTLPELIDFRE